jgi:hypothetical protein
MLKRRCDECKHIKTRTEEKTGETSMYAYCPVKNQGVNTFGKVCSNVDFIDGNNDDELGDVDDD